MKVKLFREVKSISSNGKEFIEKTQIVKRKQEKEVPAKQSQDLIFEMALGQIQLNSKRIESFKEKKKHVAGELGTWISMLQHSIKTPSI